MTLATQSLGLLATQEAATQLKVKPSTIRSWRKRCHITPVMQTRDGQRLTNWYRAEDVWACARARLTSRQVADLVDTWAEVDRLLAVQAGGCHSVS